LAKSTRDLDAGSCSGFISGSCGIRFLDPSTIPAGELFRGNSAGKTSGDAGALRKDPQSIYFFGSLFIIGYILVMGHPWALLIFLAIIPLQLWRARKEAQVLEAKFGDEYRTYRSTTWF
jgi:hypothetical protein